MRIETYRDFGYFEPGEGDELIRLARAAVVTEPPRDPGAVRGAVCARLTVQFASR